MHPFPPTDEFQCLVGEEIQELGIGPWQVRFCFGSGAVLTLEEGLTHYQADGVSEDYDCDASRAGGLSLHRLLMKPIIAVDRQDLTLTLTFQDGARLVALSDLGPYESGQFSTPSGRFLVF